MEEPVTTNESSVELKPEEQVEQPTASDLKAKAVQEASATAVNGNGEVPVNGVNGVNGSAETEPVPDVAAV